MSAIYYADPEIELAFSTLFRTFRKDFYNLYPLLVHTRIFGGSYADDVKWSVHRFTS